MVGGNMRSARMAASLTIDEVATLIGASAAVIEAVEAGLWVPRVGLILRVCGVLKCPIVDLFREVP